MLFALDSQVDTLWERINDYLGVIQPGDEGSDDPENMSNWRIGYEIETV